MIRLAQMGLTVVEVLVSLVIIGVIVAVISTVTISSVRTDDQSGARTQAVQVLSYLGRLASSSDPALLSGARSWNYGELPVGFPELAQEVHHGDPNQYRASVTEMGLVGIGSATVLLYRIQVCWEDLEAESCVSGDTAGPVTPPPGEEGFPPVVN